MEDHWDQFIYQKIVYDGKTPKFFNLKKYNNSQNFYSKSMHQFKKAAKLYARSLPISLDNIKILKSQRKQQQSFKHI